MGFCGTPGVPHRENSSNSLSLHTWASDFLRVDFHRINYGVHEPLNGAVRSFNEFSLVCSTFIYQGINFFIV
jgi:hypothetical protein